MQQAATSHPWIAAGVAVVGAGAIAAAPVVAPAPDLAELQTRAVQLTADLNFDGYTDLFTNTSANVEGLFSHFIGRPFPLLQQLLVNQVGNVTGLFSDPGQVFTNIENNFTAAFQAPFEQFDPDPAQPFLYPSVDASDNGEWSAEITKLLNFSGPLSHADLFPLVSGAGGLLAGLINGLLPGSGLGDLTNGLIEFTASPLSGVLWGEFGIVASPLVQLVTDVQDFSDDLTGSSADPVAALNDLINAPANILNAFLNGTTLDVNLLDNDSLANLIALLTNDEITSQDITTILDATGAEINLSTPIALGGLLSPGGSLFDALGINASVSLLSDVPIFGDLLETGGSVDLPGLPVGPIGSTIGLVQAMAGAIGWDDADFAANPILDIFSSL